VCVLPISPVFPAGSAAAPAYYGAPYYAPNLVGPAIGLGVGYLIGSTWYRGGYGYRHGGYHGRHWH